MAPFPKVILVFQVVLGMGYTYHVDMKQLTTQNVEALQNLKDLMEKEQLQVEPHMRENYSLAKWLHIHNFNAEATCEALKKNIQWRSEEKIGDILKEDWSDMRQRFPYTLNTCDKEDRPILYIDVDKWDIVGYLSQGKHAEERFLRYTVMYFEEMEALVWKWGKAGKYVTQGTVILNLSRFSTPKHLCLPCLQIYRKASFIIETNYPNAKNAIIAVDTPLIFRAVYWAIAPTTQKQMVLYGQDRNQWEAALRETIAPDQMPPGLLAQRTPPLAEPQYTNYNRVLQRRTPTADIPYPFPCPATEG